MTSNNPDQNPDTMDVSMPNTGTNSIAGALTFTPVTENSSHGNQQVVPSQPRQPNSLQGLLRFAMEATKAEDAPGSSMLGPMDEERKKFLEEAMRNLTLDVTTFIQEVMDILTDEEKIKSIQADQLVPDDVKTAFHNLLERAVDIDLSIDFCKMGGFAMFPLCYGSENEVVRTLASSVLGEICQNNPYCQARAVDYGLLDILLNLANTEKGYALTKTIFAISCIIRGFERGCQEFVAKDGCATLVKVLAEPERGIRNKTFFLISVLCHSFPQSRVKFIEANLVATVARHLKPEMNEWTQIYLVILQYLVDESDPRLFRQMRDPNLKLKDTLDELLELPEFTGNLFEKEKDYCLKILARAFSDEAQVYDEEPQVYDDGPDR